MEDDNKIRKTIELMEFHLQGKYNDVEKINPKLIEDWNDFRSNWYRLYTEGGQQGREKLKGLVGNMIRKTQTSKRRAMN